MTGRDARGVVVVSVVGLPLYRWFGARVGVDALLLHRINIVPAVAV
ncbi:hypothetical protein ACWFMI_23790 [Nocardiopsis terrae]